jgi:hypothetical protein
VLFSNVLSEGMPAECGVILVDGDAPDAQSVRFVRDLRKRYQCTDSVEASYKVWVKRFVPRS